MQEYKETDDQALLNVIVKVKEWIKYLRSKSFLILILSFTGILLGLAYSFIKKPLYIAECTFVLEEDKNGGMSQYAGIAAQFGISLGSEGGGIFQGDNIIELYKSNVMIKRALLTKVKRSLQKESLLQRYIDIYHLDIADIKRSGDLKRKSSVYRDSIIKVITKTIRNKNLIVEKPDKKLNIISVKTTSIDEIFSKEFTDAIVKHVNEFYVLTKTKKASQNVDIIKHQADSVRKILNLSISGVANALDANPNMNVAFKSLLVKSQTRKVDVEASSSIYAELMKNLELAKISLRRETPLIQIIDSPTYPLEERSTSKLLLAFSGFIIVFIGSVIFLLMRKAVTDTLSIINHN